MLDINEPVNVWVYFKRGSVEPFIFFWRGRKLKVDNINLVHTSKDGANIYHHFSISSQGNYYRLRFEIPKLKWLLEQVEEE
jgi:hypothetical protein